MSDLVENPKGWFSHNEAHLTIENSTSECDKNANSEYSGQTVPRSSLARFIVQSDLGLHCLPGPICLKT